MNVQLAQTAQLDLSDRQFTNKVTFKHPMLFLP